MERYSASPYLSRGTALSAGPTQKQQVFAFVFQTFHFSKTLADFFTNPNNTEKRAPPKTFQQILEIRPLDA
jgi:hypothetical protein